MPERIIYCPAVHEKSLSAAPHREIGQFAGGMVAAAGDDPALAFLGSIPGAELLFFTSESFEYALRGLAVDGRTSAVAKRLEGWSKDAANEGIEWLYRSERRCLTLTALVLRGASANTIPPNHFEHTLMALDRLVNEGAYGGSMLVEMLVNLLRSEALLQVEMARDRMTSESSARNQFCAAIAEQLRILGQPEFAEHLPNAEPSRGVWVSPPDDRLRASLKGRRLPAVDWQEGIVSVFGQRTLQTLSQQGKTMRVLYPDARQFLQDLTDLSVPQLEREFMERSKATQPFWNDYLNFLRLEIAMLRRAAHTKAAGNARVAAVLAAQIRNEDGLLAAALMDHPSWRNGEFSPQRANLLQAESDLLDDARFLSRFATMRQERDVSDRYDAFAAFKAKQLASFRTGGG